MARADSYGLQLPVAFFSDTEKTFQFDEGLPSLPVPALEQTLRKYLDSVRPHLTDAEFAHTEQIVQEFGAGVGLTLHEELCEKAGRERNWMESWWEVGAYLACRDPHTPYLNIGGPGPSLSQWPPQESTQVQRTALIMYFTLRYWQMIRRQQMKIDRLGRTNTACMLQLHRAFNNCKIPGADVDKLQDHFKTEDEGDCPSHMVVVCKGRFFQFDSLAEDGDILTVAELQQQLQHIRDVCDSEPWGAGVGSLTAGRRPDWHKMREHLQEVHPDNTGFLRDIETCITVLVLDEGSPTDATEIMKMGFYGDAINRWFDKTLQLVTFRNGTSAIIGDHCPAEGLIEIMLVYFIECCIGLLNNSDSSFKTDAQAVRTIAPPTEMTFHLDSYLMDAIDNTRALCKKNVESVETYLDTFKGYGKDFIRNHQLHPDAYVQMAIQYNYYKMYNRPAPTYETSSTRKFYHGRTETVRSCTMEALTWAKTMSNRDASNEQKVQSLVAAINKHNILMAEAMENQGCDRHLLGLQSLAADTGRPVPQLYTDPAYTKSGGGGNFVLSTSLVGYTHVFGGTVPMCKDGYGVFYNIPGKALSFFCCCWTADDSTSATGWFTSICESLDEMRSLLDKTCGDQPAAQVALTGTGNAN